MKSPTSPGDQPRDDLRPLPHPGHLERLSHVLDAGIVMIRPDRSIDHVSPQGLELLDLDDRHDQRWESVRRQFDDALDRSLEDEHVKTQIEVFPRREHMDVMRTGSLAPRRRLRLEIHCYRELPDEAAGKDSEEADGGRECTGYLVLIHDLRIVESLETDLAQAVRLRALSRIYLGTVHELRAPMNAMALNLELLRDSLGREPDAELEEKQRRWVRVIGEELERLQRSLDALLEQTAPESEETKRFDLAEAIFEIEDLVVAQTRQQSVVLESLRRRHDGDAVRVEGRRDRIKQALLTLIINALEALDEGGRVRFELTTDDETTEAVARLVDTGPGIPPELQSRIFDMRFTTKESGTGVGLHVARKIAELHGGSLRLARSDERGSIFELRLPLAD